MPIIIATTKERTGTPQSKRCEISLDYISKIRYYVFVLYLLLFRRGPSVQHAAHSNHVTSSKRAHTLICHTIMRRNPINFLYNPGHVTI